MIELTDENIIKGNLEEMIIEGTTQILNERTEASDGGSHLQRAASSIF